MEARWRQWLSNLQAMQLRVRQRLRVASTPALLMRLQSRKSLVVAGCPRPFHALLTVFLAKHLNIAVATATTFPFSVNIHNSSPSPLNADSDHPAVLRENSSAVRVLQAVALPLIGNVCHAFMHSLNKTEVYGAEKLIKAVLHRPRGQPLITVSNHVASMDDPLILAAILPPRVLFQSHCLRWTLCATDRCFTNSVNSSFFQCVKVLPLARGAGVYQKGIDMAVERLKKGDWVHIFPEGSRSRDGGKTVQAAKRGIGRLVLDAGNVPLVIPFVHSGMQDVMPIGSKFPSIKKRVVILVGDPIRMDDLFSKYHEGMISKGIIQEVIAFRVGQHLKELKEDLDHLVLSTTSRDDLKQIQNSFETTTYDGKAVSSEAFAYREAGKPDVKLDSKHRNYHTDDTHGLRASHLCSDEVFLPYNVSSATVNSVMFQEGIISRLKRGRNSAALVGFAAQGVWMSGSYMNIPLNKMGGQV